jgi:hypothetical protein
MPIQGAVRSKPYICGRYNLGDREFEACWRHKWASLVFTVSCVGSGFCESVITNSEESHRVYFSNCDAETLMTKGLGSMWAVAPYRTKSKSIIWTGLVAHLGDQVIQRCKWVPNAITNFYGIHIFALIVKIQENFNKCNTTQIYTFRTQ